MWQRFLRIDREREARHRPAVKARDGKRHLAFLNTAQKLHRDAGGHRGCGPGYQSATCVARRQDQAQTAPIVAIRFFHASENHQRSPKLSRRHRLWAAAHRSRSVPRHLWTRLRESQGPTSRAGRWIHCSLIFIAGQRVLPFADARVVESSADALNVDAAEERRRVSASLRKALPTRNTQNLPGMSCRAPRSRRRPCLRST